MSRSAVCGALFRRGIRPVPKERKVPALRHASRRRSVSADTTLPVEQPRSIAVPLLEIGATGCHWPVSKDGATTHLFCGAERSDSGHPSYCRWHFRISINARSAT